MVTMKVKVCLMTLGSLWWEMSILGAHVLASESSAPAPIYVAGCPLTDTPQKGSAGEGWSVEPIFSSHHYLSL
jgi:hypothetical protein